MAWSFNPTTGKTDDEGDPLIPRVRVEEAIDRLADSGIRNQFEIVRVLEALTNLKRSELRFNVALAFQDGNNTAASSRRTVPTNGGNIPHLDTPF